MKQIHDKAVRDEIKSRIGKLTSSSRRQWGKMTVDQMLWHCAEALDTALGNRPYGKLGLAPMLMPRALLRWGLLKGPWIKGKTPTAPNWVARQSYDLNEQRSRLLTLVDSLAARDLKSSAARHPALGDVSIEFQSQLHARHLNHHLEQFGV